MPSASQTPTVGSSIPIPQRVYVNARATKGRYCFLITAARWDPMMTGAVPTYSTEDGLR